MDRSISQLRAAAFAGEPLSAEEIVELARYEAVAGRLDVLRQTLPPDEQTRAETGDECEAFIADVLSGLDTQDDADVLRQRIRELVIIVRLQADRLAERTGLTRRQRREKQHGGQHSGTTRRKAVESIFDAIAAVKARNPAHTDAAAARIYLQEYDPSWLAGTDDERMRKVAALERRIRRARKNTGHELS